MISWERVKLGGGIFMAKKGQVFQQYTEEFKLAAIKEYMKGSASYKTLAEKLGVRNCTQLKVWVKRWKNGEEFDLRKEGSNPLKGRPRTFFDTVEEERDYLRAQVAYLKKRYPNLVKEKSVSAIIMK
jgi:transposase